MKRGLIALALTAVVPIAAAGASTTLRLVCAWDYSLDTKTMQNSPTSGKVLLSIEPNGTLRKEGLGALFKAHVTEEAIEAETEYRLRDGGIVYTQRISINRFTGAIENWVLIGKEGLIHYGTCKQAPRQLF